jgi:hypothetical protein
MKEIKYEDYRGMIYREAKRTSALKGVEFEEALSCAKLAFFEAKATFKESKGAKFQTWLFFYFQHHVWRAHTHTLSVDFEWSSEDPNTRLVDLFDQLSHEAREIALLTLSLPYDFELTKTKLGHHLHRLGWKWEAIWRAFRELKVVFS